MKRTDYVIGGAVLAIIVIVAVLVIVAQNQPKDFTQFGQSSVFDFAYPPEWEAQIPQANFVLAGPPQVLAETEVGPSFTIGRAVPGLGEDLLQGFLDTRIFSDDIGFGQEWEIVGEREDLLIGETHEAQTILLEGRTSEDAELYRQQIYTTRADNNVVYVFVTAAPADVWDDNTETFARIIDSIIINE